MCDSTLRLLLDVVQYMDQENSDDPDLGETRPRDPDALPPANLFELIMLWLYRAFAALRGGNVVFAVKAGLLTGASSFFLPTNSILINLLKSP